MRLLKIQTSTIIVSICSTYKLGTFLWGYYLFYAFLSNTFIQFTEMISTPLIRRFVFITCLVNASVIRTLLTFMTIILIYTAYTNFVQASPPPAFFFRAKSVWIVIVAAIFYYALMLYTFVSIGYAIFWTLAFPFLWYASCPLTRMSPFTLSVYLWAIIVKLAFNTLL
jgi:hypothetical protein